MRGAALGALVFSLSGFCRTSLDTLTTFSAFAWIPFILLLTLGGPDRWRLISAGLALACLTLAGIPDQVLLALAGLAILGGWPLARNIPWVVLGLVPALPQILAGLEFVARSDRWLTPGASTIWSLRLVDLSAWFFARVPRPESVADYWMSQHWLGSPYLGLTTGLLIAAALATATRRPSMRHGYWPALALMLALAVGAGAPVWGGAGAIIPGLDVVRYPVKAATWITWLLAWLAAAAASRLAEGRARGATTVLAFVVAADLLMLGPAGPALIPPAYYTAPARLDPFLRATGGRVVIEPRTFHELDVLKGPSLQSALWSAREFRPPNLHRLAGLDSLQTYGSMNLTGHAQFDEALTRMPLGPAVTRLRQAGVGSVISAARLAHPDLIPGTNTLEAPFAYRLRAPWPVIRLARRPDLNSPPEKGHLQTETVRGGWYRVIGGSARPAWLVAAENWHPGWVAVIRRAGARPAPTNDKTSRVAREFVRSTRTTDSRPVLPLGQAVAVPAGDWEITLRYVPRGFGGSVGLAAAGLAVMAGLGTKKMRG